MTAKILKVLDFFRLIDENATLSLTNIAVMIVLVKVALDPQLNYSTVATLLGVIGSYTFKRYTQRDKRAELFSQVPDMIEKQLADRLEKVQSQLNHVKLKVGLGND